MLDLEKWNLMFGLTLAILWVAIACIAGALKQNNRRWWLAAAGAGALSVVSLFLSGWSRVVVLDAAALLAVALVWLEGSAEARKAARTYLFLLVPALVFIALGMLLGGEGAAAEGSAMKAAAILLVVGFGLKLALIPFYFWLPGVAQAVPALTTAVIVSIVDIASFSELVHLRETSGWLFENNSGIWLAVGLLSMFGGALLALAQKDLKRMLAFSTIDDLGYLILGLAAGGQLGLQGALFGALSHAVCKVILFGAVAVAEKRLGHSITLSDGGLAACYPACGVAFIAGSLGMLGVPPTLGFLGRWRLYQSGVTLGGAWLGIAMAAATALALLYYVRAIHRVWLGPAQTEEIKPEPILAKVVLVVLVVAVVALGFYPGLWTGLLG
jgi:multicomponent Na+:H+ antiporter subunit D